jgi:hypothetical protein
MSRPRLRGHIWFIRRYGLRRWRAYERDRRAGLTIDYSKVFTLDGLSTWGKKIE